VFGLVVACESNACIDGIGAFGGEQRWKRKKDLGTLQKFLSLWGYYVLGMKKSALATVVKPFLKLS